MIEEIKKEITGLIHNIEPFDTCCKATMNVIEGMVNQTLDKYKDKEDTPKSTKNLRKEQLENLCLSLMKTNEEKTKYVRAWEELKEYITKENITIQGVEVLEQEDLIDKIEELEQKHGIEVE